MGLCEYINLMTIPNLSFPIQHISVRVPWHDRGWEGTVCVDPASNSACLKLPRIAEDKDETSEIKVAGRHFRDLQSRQLPPCVVERVAFMSPYGFPRSHEHPYVSRNPDTHGHFKPTPLNYRPYTAPALPFRWMSKDSLSELRHAAPLDEVEESLEPKLGFETAWWQDYRNQTALLESFWAHVKQGTSLVFFYVKQLPLADDMPGRRFLVGVGRVKSVGPLTEYEYDGSPEGRLRSMLWERMMGHSIRPDFEDGFLMPYHEALDRSRDGQAFDPTEIVALAPEDRFTEFSYGTEHVGDDAAIEALLSMRSALLKSAELFGVDIQKQEAWIDGQLGRLWRERGPFPGMGAVLHAYGVPLGNFVAKAVSEQAKDDRSPWSVWYSLLDSPEDFLQRELAKCVDHTTSMTWKGMSSERRAFLELLSRVDLTQEQAKALVTPEVRRARGIDGEDAAFIENPYLLYEATRLTSTPVSISSVDRGLLPSPAIRGKFAAPKPSRIDTSVDARRLRALSIRELEVGTVEGHTLVPREQIITSLRLRNQADSEEPTLLTGDHLRFAEDTLFAGHVRVVTMADHEPAYQLERLGAAGDLIRKTVERRTGGRRHGMVFDWRAELDEYLDKVLKVPPPTNSIEANADDLARTEKAAALSEISNARLSVLVGSAGTGKTTLLSVLCNHPEIKRDGIVLLAPTGKARVRMEEIVSRTGLEGIRAFTLAQFLIRSGRYESESQRYLLTGQPAQRLGRTVIVDECSMLTEEMLAALIESLTGVDRLVLVGDPRQLPPIGPGRPFVDVTRRLRPDSFTSNAPKVGPSYAELTVPMRQDVQDRDGLELAKWFGGEPGPSDDSVFEILSGHRVSDTVKIIRWDSTDDLREQLPQVLAEHLGFDDDRDESLQFAESLGGQVKGRYAYFNVGRSGAKAEAWQILSPFRQKAWGVDPLNRLIHRRYRSRQVDSSTRQQFRFLKPQGDQLIVYGDKIINNRNIRTRRYLPVENWKREQTYVANGEIGVVVGEAQWKRGARQPQALEVEFSTQTETVVKFWKSDFDQESEANLELAYALTIHKAQGSEFDTVILILPESKYMLTRELMYTALTRQKKKLIILLQGSPTDIQRLSSEEFSDAARRLTNLFAPPTPVQVGENLLEDRLIHRTARGEAVRSKSEVIIANLLHAKGLEYLYEEPLEIDGVTKYPDFTIEDDDSGVKYYWEHLGMLSDEIYRKRWKKKKEWLRSHGILSLEEGGGSAGTLITTQDSSDGGIDSQAVSQLVEELF